MSKIAKRDSIVSDYESSRKKSKHELPSFAEQSQLNATEMIINSNLLNLEITELLDEVKCNKKSAEKAALEGLVDHIKGILSETSSKYANQEISSKWIEKKKIENISLMNYKQSSISLSFQPPTAVDVIGSYPVGTETSPLINLDIAVQMDKSCFDER
jgi:hypothetical protein